MDLSLLVPVVPALAARAGVVYAIACRGPEIVKRWAVLLSEIAVARAENRARVAWARRAEIRALREAYEPPASGLDARVDGGRSV